MTSEADEEVVLVYKQGIEVPANVTKIIFDASVTEIPNGINRQGIFSQCKLLREVVLNEGLWKIGNYAFYGCSLVTIIKLPSTVTEVGFHAFGNCSNLREVLLNEGLQKIGGCAFNFCTSLTIIKFPSTLTKLGSRAFGCTNLREAVLNEGMQRIGDRAFGDCTNLKEIFLNEGLQKIGNGAFVRCTSLTIIKLPSTVTEIGEMAFYFCTNLSEVILNEGVQSIGDDAFCGCRSKIIKFPSTVIEVGAHAFDHCTNLREVTLNEGLQEIGSGAFHDCTSLTVVKFDDISKRAKNLIEAGQWDIEDKVTVSHYFGWRGGDLLVFLSHIRNDNWAAVRTNLDQLMAWISHYELKEATTSLELALWKARIGELGAVTDEERSACRVDIPGPAKDAILQFLQHTNND